MDAKLQQAQEMLKEAEERHQREKDFVRLRLWDWGSWKRWVGSGLAHSHVCMGKVGAWPEQGTVSSDTSQGSPIMRVPFPSPQDGTH